MAGPVGVTGATGELGGRVARRLADRGVAQRLVVRDPSRAPELPGAEVRAAPGGYADGDGLRGALEGVATLLLVPAGEALDRADQHRRAVDAAAAVGVERIVYLSFVDTTPDGTFTFGRDHWATEEHVRAVGVPFTFLRMSLYLDYVPFFVGADGVIRGPAGEGHMAPVARDDLADVAVAVLLEDGHEGRTEDVTGRDRFTLGARDARAVGPAGLGDRGLGHELRGHPGRRGRRDERRRAPPRRARADHPRRVPPGPSPRARPRDRGLTGARPPGGWALARASSWRAEDLSRGPSRSTYVR